MLPENSEFRLKARTQLKGNWGTPILACFLVVLISGVLSVIPGVGGLISLIISGPLSLGLILFSLKFSRDEKPQVGSVFDGFNNFVPALAMYLWNLLWVFLWMLLLIVPGIIKAISYSMCFYILADNPGIGAKKALKLSMAITEGYKARLFILGLSFIGWALLSILTLFIGFLWLSPYMQITMANFYNELKAETIANGKYVVS